MSYKNIKAVGRVEKIKKFFKFTFDVIGGSIRDSAGAYSAHTAFFVTISFIPFIILLIAIVRFLPFTETELLNQVPVVFPQAARKMVSSFLQEAYQKSGTAVISVAAVTTLWAASIGIFSLVRGINKVYGTEETRNYFIVRFASMVYTIFLLALMILCLGFFVFGGAIAQTIERIIPAAAAATLIVMSMRILVGFIAMSLIFAVMFTFIPNRKGKFLVQVPGAAVASAGWIIFSTVFSYYYENISNYSYIYGSLSILVFFMIWIYVCIYILLIGAEVNRCIEDRLYGHR